MTEGRYTEVHLRPGPADPVLPAAAARGDGGGPALSADGGPVIDPDMLASLYQRGRLALAGHAVGGLAVLTLYHGLVPGHALLVWTLVFALAWAVRAVAVRRYRRPLPPSVVDLARAHRLWEITTVVSGLVWGLAVALLFPYGGPLHRLGLVLVVVSYCLAAPATSYAVYLFYAAACFLPVVVHLSFSKESHSLVIAGAVSAVFLAILVVARQDLRMFERLHSLKRRDALLVRELEVERNAAHAARELAEAANRAKTRFFAAASHDLRQPLHAVSLFTRSLQHHDMDTQARQLVTSIDEATYAMERLFDQLLDLDRIDSGGLVVRPQAVEMADIYRRVRVHVEAIAFDKGLALTFRGGQHLVWADPLMLERVLRNLVANAIRYTEDGGVLVACRRRSGRCVLQVWDTGIGIASEALPQVFDEFYQLEAAQRPETGEYRGLGLGLAIVRRLVTLMQVPLSVRTRVGQGTAVTVELPVPEPVAVTDAVAEPGWRQRVTLAGRRVLVVETDAVEAATLAALLRSWSAEVQVFADAAALRRAGVARAPDLLIVGDVVAADAAAARGWPGAAGAGVAAPEGCRGEAVADWLQACAGAAVPTMVLVAPGALAGPLPDGAGPATPAPGLQILNRPVQALRLRALVAYMLMAPTLDEPARA